jgi:hypothetical protein
VVPDRRLAGLRAIVLRNKSKKGPTKLAPSDYFSC